MAKQLLEGAVYGFIVGIVLTVLYFKTRNRKMKTIIMDGFSAAKEKEAKLQAERRRETAKFMDEMENLKLSDGEGYIGGVLEQDEADWWKKGEKPYGEAW